MRVARLGWENLCATGIARHRAHARAGNSFSGFVSSADRLRFSGKDSARNASTLRRMLSTPGLGQSVPHKSCASSSAIRGKYSSNPFGRDA